MKVVPFYSFFFLVSFISSASGIPNLSTNFLAQLYSTYDAILATLPAPPDFDFWKSAQELGDKAVKYADAKLQEEAILYSVASDKIEEFKQGMKDLISSADILRIDTHDALVKRDFNFTEFTEALSAEIDVVIADLMLEFQEPPPENQTERYQRREAAVTKALDKIEDALVKVYGVWGVSEEEAKEKFSHVKPHIKHVVLIIGNLADNHPIIADIVIFSAVVLIVTPVAEGLILRPLLRVFGFSPLGPVKGSPAAWAQRYFFGAMVKEGSWFARLQSAGMKWVPPGLGKKIGVPIGIGAGIIGGMKGCR